LQLADAKPILGRLQEIAVSEQLQRYCGDRRITAPVSELLPEQVSPELLHLQVKLAAQLPYRQAACALGRAIAGN
jgi:hypothetical protein